MWVSSFQNGNSYDLFLGISDLMSLSIAALYSRFSFVFGSFLRRFSADTSFDIAFSMGVRWGSSVCVVLQRCRKK